jgi:hypothetical protein
MDPPTGARTDVFVVVAQMPDHVGGLPVCDVEMVCGACYSAQRVVGLLAGRVNLADYRMFGAGEAGQRRHGGANPVAATVVADRIK